MRDNTVNINAKDVLALLPPYPIVLVSTRTNVITVNQVMYFTFSPLRIGVAVAHGHYTHELLREEGEFVINVPDAGLVGVVKQCGTVSGRKGDKFVFAGLTPQPSTHVAAVSIAECCAHIECRVEREIAFERRTWFVGEVVAARQSEGHSGVEALLCGREDYRLPGVVVAER